MLIIYDSGGRIVAVLSSSVPDGGGELVAPTESGVSSLTHYVHDGELTELPAMTASLDGYVLTAPVGASWRLVEPSIGVDETGTVGGDGEVEFEFDDTGTYALTVSLFPALDFTAEIEVE